ncbi:MAG: ROK family protein [Nanoarchaeota archaeon]
MSLVIGVDVGGTYIKAGLVRDGKILKKIQVPSLAKKSEKEFVDNINSVISKLKAGKKIKAIGIACAGAIDVKKGIVINSPNTPLRNFPLREVICKKHKLPVYMDNDASCFILAEAVHGAGKNYDFVAGIVLGTGVGGGIVINKKLFHGRSNAGEFGHITLDMNGWMSPTGLQGHLEEYVGSRGVMRLAKRVSVISPEHVYKLAEKGDGEAKFVWEKFGEYLGIGIANIVYAVDPQVVIVGGQISKAWKYFRQSMKIKAQESCFFPMPPIARASTVDSGILGAALICRK